MKKIAILCSGGDCQGMNACIKAVADTCDSNQIELIGINRGYQGLIENDIRELKKIDVANIETIAGALIKTSRSPEFMTEEGFNKAIANLKLNGIEGLIVIGGNGYITNGRCSSTGEDRTSNNGYIVTNYIDIKNGDTVYIENASISTDANNYSGMKLTDGTTIGLYPNNSEYITNYSESNGITQFTINKADADYIRITLEIYTDGKSATEERVSALGIIITVNEPLS